MNSARVSTCARVRTTPVVGGGAVLAAIEPPEGLAKQVGGWVLAFAKGSGESLRKVAIRGDGRCLFRSIARGIAALEGRKLTESMECADADALRNAAYGTMCTGKRRAEFEKSMLVEGNFSAYCASMRHSSHYGGEAEMFVLSDILKLPIAVYLPAGAGSFQKIVEYGSKFAGKVARPVRVLYNGVNHYDLLLD